MDWNGPAVPTELSFQVFLQAGCGLPVYTPDIPPYARVSTIVNSVVFKKRKLSQSRSWRYRMECKLSCAAYAAPGGSGLQAGAIRRHRERRHIAGDDCMSRRSWRQLAAWRQRATN